MRLSSELEGHWKLESRMLMKVARPVCAVRRVVVSLLQAGGIEEEFLGYRHSRRRKLKVTKHAEEAMHARKRCRTGHSYDPLPMGKAGLPERES
jgi:hypothetical protein